MITVIAGGKTVGRATEMDAAYSWLRRSVSKLKNTSNPPDTSASGADEHKSKGSENELQEEEAEKVYGITDELIEFIKTFSIETFRNFSLPDDEGSNCDGDSSGNVRKDLTDWQESHAMLVLSRVKDLAQLRFKLCPRYLKERQFWRIYFKLVENYVARYELHAIQLAKLKQLRAKDETGSNASACEVEMSEAKFSNAADPAP